MNIIIRRFRRWKHAKRCGACHRKFMFVHKCRCTVGVDPASGPDYTVLPEGMKVERKLKPNECCETCTGQEIANDRRQD